MTTTNRIAMLASRLVTAALAWLACVAAPVVAQDSNDTSGTAFKVTEIILSCVGLGLWVLLLIFAKDSVLGTVITVLARKFGGLTTGATDENGQPDPKFFQLGGFSISMFAGRIKFKNLQYTDRDLSITVMDGGIDLRYWVRHYKKSIGGSGKERVKVRLSGLSCHVYNRGKTYAALKHLSEMVDLQFDDAGDSLYDVKPIGPDETFPETELPWLMKIVPVVRVNVTGGRVIVGNHTLPSILYLSFRKADVSSYVEIPDDGRCPDPYINVLKARYKGFKLRLMPNASYDGTIGPETEAKYDVKGQKGRPRTGSNQSASDASFYGWRCDQVDMQIRMAAAGLVTAENRDAEPPEFSVRFDCRKPAEIVWEASMGFQAAALARFFNPWDYQTLSISQTPQVGMPRVVKEAVFTVNFGYDIQGNKLGSSSGKEGPGVQINVLFNGPDWTAEELNTDQVELCFRAHEGSITFVQPYTIIDEGYENRVKLHLGPTDARDTQEAPRKNVAITTSLPYAPLVETCEQFELGLCMLNPRRYDDCYYWSFDVKLEKPVIHYLDIHKVVLLEMFKQFPAPRVDFTEPDLGVPIVYDFKITVHAFHLLWCVNKDNVFSTFPPDPSNLGQFKLDEKGGEPGPRTDPLEDDWDNSYLDWKGKVFKVEWSNFYPEYSSPFYNTHYDISVDSVEVFPLLPTWNIAHFIDKGSNSRDKLTVKQIRLTMDSHFNDDQKNPALRDTMCITLFFQTVQGQLTGPIALGLARLRENYFGRRKAPTFRTKVVALRKKKPVTAAPPKYLMYCPKYDYTAKRPQYHMTVELNVKSAELSLPAVLYGVSEPNLKISLPDLSLGIALDDHRMDIIVSIHEVALAAPLGKFIALHSLKVHQLSLSAVDIDKNIIETYCTQTDVLVASIHGSMLAGQLLELSQWASCFVYHFNDLDHTSPPPEKFIENLGSQSDVENGYATLRAVIQGVDVQLATRNEDTVLQLLTDEEIVATSDNLNRPSSVDFLNVTTGQLFVHQYARVTAPQIPSALRIKYSPTDEHGSMREVGTITTSVCFTKRTRVPKTHLKIEEQMTFLHKHDYLFGELQFFTAPHEEGLRDSRGFLELPWAATIRCPNIEEIDDWDGQMFSARDPVLPMLQVLPVEPIILHDHNFYRMAPPTDENAPATSVHIDSSSTSSESEDSGPVQSTPTASAEISPGKRVPFSDFRIPRALTAVEEKSEEDDDIINSDGAAGAVAREPSESFAFLESSEGDSDSSWQSVTEHAQNTGHEEENSEKSRSEQPSELPVFEPATQRFVPAAFKTRDRNVVPLGTLTAENLTVLDNTKKAIAQKRAEAALRSSDDDSDDSPDTFSGPTRGASRFQSDGGNIARQRRRSKENRGWKKVRENFLSEDSEGPQPRLVEALPTIFASRYRRSGQHRKFSHFGNTSTPGQESACPRYNVLLPSVLCEHKIDYRDQTGHTQYRKIHFEEKPTDGARLPKQPSGRQRGWSSHGSKEPLNTPLQPVIVPRTESTLDLVSPLSIVASPLLAVALEWVIRDIERHADTESADSWKRELDNLQIAYTSPIVASSVNEEESSTETFTVMSVKLIAVSLVQDGYLLPPKESETQRKKTTPPKLSAASLAVLEIHNVELNSFSSVCVFDVNSRRSEVPLQKSTTAVFSELTCHILGSSSYVPVPYGNLQAFKCPTENQDLFNTCVLYARISDASVAMLLNLVRSLNEPDQDFWKGNLVIEDVEFQAFPGMTCVLGAVISSWTIAMDGLTAAAKQFSTSIDQLKRAMLSQSLSKIPSSQSTWDVFERFAQSQSGAMEFSRSRNLVRVGDSSFDHNRFLLILLQLQADRVCAEDIGSDRWSKSLIILPSMQWYPSNIEEEIGHLINGFISANDARNPLGVKHSKFYLDGQILEVKALLHPFDKKHDPVHVARLTSLLATAEASYTPSKTSSSTTSECAALVVNSMVQLDSFEVEVSPAIIRHVRQITDDLALASLFSKYWSGRKFDRREKGVDVTTNSDPGILNDTSMAYDQDGYRSRRWSPSPLKVAEVEGPSFQLSDALSVAESEVWIPTNDRISDDGPPPRLGVRGSRALPDYVTPPREAVSARKSFAMDMRRQGQSRWRTMKVKGAQKNQPNNQASTLPADALHAFGTANVEDTPVMTRDVYIWGFVDKTVINTTVNQTSLKLDVSRVWGTHHIAPSPKTPAPPPTTTEDAAEPSLPATSPPKLSGLETMSSALSIAEVKLEGTRKTPRRHVASGHSASHRRSHGSAKDSFKIFLYGLNSIDGFVTKREEALTVIINMEKMAFRLHDSMIAAEDVLEEWISAIATIPPAEPSSHPADGPKTDRPLKTMTMMLNLGNTEIAATVLPSVKATYKLESVQLCQIVEFSDRQNTVLRMSVVDHFVVFETRTRRRDDRQKPSFLRSMVGGKRVEKRQIKLELPNVTVHSKCRMANPLSDGDSRPPSLQPGSRANARPSMSTRTEPYLSKDVNILFSLMRYRLSNAATNELLYYQEAAASDLNHLTDMFSRLFRQRAQMKQPTAGVESTIGPSTTKLAVKFEGIELCLESSLPQHIIMKKPSTEGFILFTQSVTVLVESRVENENLSSVKMVTEVHPVLFFGHIPHSHTRESLQSHPHVGRLKMKINFSSQSTSLRIDEDEVRSDSKSFLTVDSPSVLVPWQAIPKLVSYFEDFNFFYLSYHKQRQSLDAATREATQSLARKAKTASAAAAKRISRDSHQYYMKFSLQSALIRVALHGTRLHGDQNRGHPTSVNPNGSFLILTLHKTEVILGEQGQSSVGDFTMLQVGLIDAPVNLEDGEFRSIMNNNSTHNVAWIPEGNLRFRTVHEIYPHDIALKRGKASKTTVAFRVHVGGGRAQKGIEMKIGVESGRLVELVMRTQRAVTGKVALIDRSRSSGDNKEIDKMRTELLQRILILEQLLEFEAEESSTVYMTKQILSMKKSLKRAEQKQRMEWKQQRKGTLESVNSDSDSGPAVEPGTTEFFFDWSIDLVRGTCQLFVPPEHVSHYEGAPQNSASRGPQSLYDKEEIPIPGVTLKINYQPSNPAAIGETGEVSGHLNGVLRVHMMKEFSVSPDVRRFIEETSATYERAVASDESRHHQTTVYTQGEDDVTDAQWDTDALQENLPPSYSIHAWVSEWSVIFTCKNRAPVEARVDVPKFQLFLSSTENVSNVIDPTMTRSFSAWLDPLSFAVQYHKGRSESLSSRLKSHRRQPAVKFTLHDVHIHIAERKSHGQHFEDHRVVSVLAEIKQIFADFDSTQNADIVAFQKVWKPHKVRRTLSVSASMRPASVGDSTPGGHLDVSVDSRMNSSSDDTSDTDVPLDPLEEDEALQGKQPAHIRPTAVIVICKLQRARVASHLDKHIGKLVFNVNSLLGRAHMISDRPKFRAVHASVKFVNLEDEGVLKPGQASHGQPRGSSESNGITVGFVESTPPDEHSPDLSELSTPNTEQRIYAHVQEYRSRVFEVHDVNYMSEVPMLIAKIDNLRIGGRVGPNRPDEPVDRDGKRCVTVECSWDDVGIVLCGRTSLFLARIRRRITHAVNAHAILGYDDIQINQIDVEDNDSDSIPTNESPTQSKVIPTQGCIRAIGGNTRILILPVSFNDKEWAVVGLSGMTMVFGQEKPNFPQISRKQSFTVTLDAPQGHGQRNAAILLSHHIRKDASTPLAMSAALNKDSSVEDWLETFVDVRGVSSRARSIFSVPSVTLKTGAYIDDARSSIVHVYSKLVTDFDGVVRVTGNTHYYYDLRVFLNKFMKASRLDGNGDDVDIGTPIEGKSISLDGGADAMSESLESVQTISQVQKFSVLVKEDVAFQFFTDDTHGPSRVAVASELFPEVVKTWHEVSSGFRLPKSPEGAALVALVCTACPQFQEQMGSSLQLLDYSFEPKMQPIEEYGTDISWDIDSFVHLLLPKGDAEEPTEVLITRILHQYANTTLGEVLDQVGNAAQWRESRHSSVVSTRRSTAGTIRGFRSAEPTFQEDLSTRQDSRMARNSSLFADAISFEDVAAEHSDGSTASGINHRESIYYSVSEGAV